MNIFWGYNAQMVTIVNICIVYLKLREWSVNVLNTHTHTHAHTYTYTHKVITRDNGNVS